MSRGRPLLAATAIATVAVLVGGLAAGAVLALVGYPADTTEVAAALGWTGRDDSAAQAAAAQRKARTPDDPVAVALLARAGQAAQTVAYNGATLTTGTGTAAPIAVDVIGLPGVGTVIDAAGGSMVLAGQGRSSSLADAAAVLGLLVDNFRVIRESALDRTIAGRAADAVLALRPDHTLAARFWLDRTSGLLLRRDLVGRGGLTVSSTWFVRMRMGDSVVEHPPPLAADPWSHVLDAPARARWKAAGCTCEDLLPDGFTLLQARTDDAGEDAGPGKGVVHLLYSDGLTEVSLFDQPGRLDEDAEHVLEKQGFAPVASGGVAVLERVAHPASGTSGVATGEWVWESGRSVLTLVGPAGPRAAAEELASEIVVALQPPSAEPGGREGGVMNVLSRGWNRIGAVVRQAWDHLR